jgi:hypothetical protein
MTVTLVSPLGAAQPSTLMLPGGVTIVPASDGTIILQPSQYSFLDPLLNSGWRFFRYDNENTFWQAPIAAELVSIVAAAAPTSLTPMTIAGQPDIPRKLQVRGVYSGAVANLVVNLVGVDGRGNAVTETVNVAAAVSTTFPTVNAYSVVTSVTPVGTTTNVTTIGIGVGPALALLLPPSFSQLVVTKETVAATGTASMVHEATGTVDTVAGTVSPTSAPNGAKNFAFYYTFGTLS